MIREHFSTYSMLQQYIQNCAPRHSLRTNRAAFRLRQRESHCAHHVGLRVKQLWVALRQWEHRFLAEQSCLTIELLPHMPKREVGVAGERVHLLHWSLELGECAMPLEGMDDLLGSHCCKKKP